MKIAIPALLIVCVQGAFVPTSQTVRSRTQVRGYLDDLSKELSAPSQDPDIEADSKDATDLDKRDVDRYGVGNWQSYVEFNEFDGGDGQMGVAGDGKQGLEKFGRDVQPQLAKSKVMSAKNAWGRATGYAEVLIDKGVESVRAQQLENWHNQQELRQRANDHKKMTEEFDRVTYEEDWRTLSKFGVERNENFNLDETFGAVQPGQQLDGTLELVSRIGQVSIRELQVKNEYMGFADFRAAIIAERIVDWTVTPSEGSLSKDPVNFVLKFRPNAIGLSEGYLVIETEDFKKTWRIIGSTA